MFRARKPVKSKQSKPVALDCALGAQELAEEVAKLRELERQYCQRLGRMAQLCNTVIPHLLDCLHESQVADLPEEVTSGIGEIMDYVDSVRP